MIHHLNLDLNLDGLIYQTKHFLNLCLGRASGPLHAGRAAACLQQMAVGPIVGAREYATATQRPHVYTVCVCVYAVRTPSARGTVRSVALQYVPERPGTRTLQYATLPSWRQIHQTVAGRGLSPIPWTRNAAVQDHVRPAARRGWIGLDRPSGWRSCAAAPHTPHYTAGASLSLGSSQCTTLRCAPRLHLAVRFFFILALE
jgi:hypothetical protein